jgi:hypothetical protein
MNQHVHGNLKMFTKYKNNKNVKTISSEVYIVIGMFAEKISVHCI